MCGNKFSAHTFSLQECISEKLRIGLLISTDISSLGKLCENQDCQVPTLSTGEKPNM